MSDEADRLLASRSEIYRDGEPVASERAEEGGCGVTGFACNIPVRGKFIYEPSIQMQNRGNGKGGGIAACGLVPEDMGVSRRVLDEDYILQVALLDPKVRAAVEKEFVEPLSALNKEWGDATLKIGEKVMKNLDEVGAASVDFTMYSGYIVLAYMWAQMAKVSLPKQSDEFYQAKVQTARFYYQRVLPRTKAHHAMMLAGGDSMMDVTL